MGFRSALRADVGGRQPNGLSVREQPGAVARSQLSEGGAVGSGQVGFGCGDVWSRELQDFVGRAVQEVVQDGAGVDHFDSFFEPVRVHGAVCISEATDVGSDGRLE